MKFERLMDGLVALMLLTALGWVHCADGAVDEQRWHVMSIDGVTVGSVHETETRQEDRWVSTESASLALNRLGTRLEIETRQRSVETAEGILQSVNQTMRTSDQPMGLDAFMEGDEWVTRPHGEAAPERRQRLQQPLLGPLAIRQRFMELQASGDEIRYHGFVAGARPGGRPLRRPDPGHRMAAGLVLP